MSRKTSWLHSWARTSGGRACRNLLRAPMYTNAAGIIPIVEALIGKGAALGTVLAFMMSVIALSAPEIIILQHGPEASPDCRRPSPVSLPWAS